MSRKFKPSTGRQAQVIATHETKNALMEWLERSPLKIQQGQVVAALIRWFIRQKPFVKTAVLSGLDQGMEHAYATALRQLADEVDGNRSAAIPTAIYDAIQAKSETRKQTVEAYLIEHGEQLMAHRLAMQSARPVSPEPSGAGQSTARPPKERQRA